MKVSVFKELSLLSQSAPVRGLGSGFPLAEVAGESPACCRCDSAMNQTIPMAILFVNANGNNIFDRYEKTRTWRVSIWVDESFHV